MEREQIIKALECCEQETKSCPSCPLARDYSPCSKTMARNALTLIKELTEENERLRAEVSVKKKLLDEADRRYDETAKRFYKEGVKDIQSEIKKTLSALCKGDVTDICRMIDQIAKEMLEGEKGETANEN